MRTQRTRIRNIFLIVAAALLVFGCATGGKSTPEAITGTSYKALVVAADTYDIAMKSLASPMVQAQIGLEERAKILEVARVYYTAYQAASQALYTYTAVASADSEARLGTAIAEMSAALARLMQLAEPYIPKGGKTL